MNFIPEPSYMRRALRLATYGAGFVSPNPMVGAVITASDGRIIGEGWHRRFGGPHAEVNAVASVRDEDKHLLSESTIYVTLEPCSHYGKTPPCSKLLIEKGLRRVVIGSADPFPLVRGRGIKMLREAGIEVIEDFLRQECDFLNRRFITAHTLGRPYVQLKWAQSRDGFMAALREDGLYVPVTLSSPLTSRLMHRERALADAILVGTNTVVSDNPSLTVRLWPGHDPRPVTFRSDNLPPDAKINREELILLGTAESLPEQMNCLYRDFGITSLMVEGGADTLRRFLDSGPVDEIRLEISPILLGEGLRAPAIPGDFIRIELDEIGHAGVTTGFDPVNRQADTLISTFVSPRVHAM